MKLRQFNESLERLGGTYLTEADANVNIKQELEKRYSNLTQIKDRIAKNLSQVQLQDVEQINYNETLLTWLATLVRNMNRISKGSIKDPKQAISYVDYYTKHIVDSLKSGKLVQESLVESMNTTFGRL